MMLPISFIGNIGCGKSTWGKALEQRGWTIFYEKLAEFNFLKEYWNNRKNSFQTQIEFYSSWFRQYIQASRIDKGILDSSIITHHNVFTRQMLEKNLLSQREYKVCNDLYNNILEVANCKYIFLYCDYEECIRRSSIRARENELRGEEMIAYVQNKLQDIYDKFKKDITLIDITNLSPTCESDIDLFIKKMQME